MIHYSHIRLPVAGDGGKGSNMKSPFCSGYVDGAYKFEVGFSPGGVQWISYDPPKTLPMIVSFYEQFGTKHMRPVARDILSAAGVRG